MSEFKFHLFPDFDTILTPRHQKTRKPVFILTALVFLDIERNGSRVSNVLIIRIIRVEFQRVLFPAQLVSSPTGTIKSKFFISKNQIFGFRIKSIYAYGIALRPITFEFKNDFRFTFLLRLLLLRLRFLRPRFFLRRTVVAIILYA